MGTLVGITVLKSSIERAERLSHLTQDELFESLARQRQVSASKTTGEPKGLSGGTNWGRGKCRRLRASVPTDAQAKATEQSVGKAESETDASASSEETR